MLRLIKISSLLVLVLALLPLSAGAIVEEKSEKEYTDQITVGTDEQPIVLQATGVALREKTFMKVDVYTIVSYVQAGQTPVGGSADEIAEAIRVLNAPKRIQMDLLRSFSREKLVNSFTDVIGDNYEDTSAFDADLQIFLAYFENEAQENDVLIFDFCPVAGLITHLNGEKKGVIENKLFADALWTVWFGKEPADDDMKEALISVLVK